MTSGPYQSNLLRFVLGQYRQGMSRHRRAVRQARSTASLGAALTLLPVYAVVYASQRIARQLGQAVTTGRWFGMAAKTAELLDFSDFDQAFALKSSATEGSNSTKLSRIALESNGLAESLTEYPMVQALLAVGKCLSPAQVKLLSGMTAASSRQLAVQSFSRALQQRAASLFNRRRRADLQASQRITGIASDLKTRSLVLILGQTTVWKGLSAVQQGQLQSQIALFLEREGAQPADSFAATQPLGSLSGRLAPVLDLLTHDLAQALTHRKSAIVAAPAARTVAVEIPSGDLSYCLEADVIAVDYIEHPLEKLLKWVDQILLWLEKWLGKCFKRSSQVG